MYFWESSKDSFLSTLLKDIFENITVFFLRIYKEVFTRLHTLLLGTPALNVPESVSRLYRLVIQTLFTVIYFKNYRGFSSLLLDLYCDIVF